MISPRPGDKGSAPMDEGKVAEEEEAVEGKVEVEAKEEKGGE